MDTKRRESRASIPVITVCEYKSTHSGSTSTPHLAVNKLVNIGWSLFMLELRKLRGSRNLSKSKSSESSFDSVISWRKRTIFNFNFNFWGIFGKRFVFFFLRTFLIITNWKIVFVRSLIHRILSRMNLRRKIYNCFLRKVFNYYVFE